MSSQCPVCEKETKSVETLFLHLVNHDKRHDTWLESYCSSNNINLMRLLAKRANDVEGANEPLTEALKRDFCK